MDSGNRKVATARLIKMSSSTPPLSCDIITTLGLLGELLVTSDEVPPPCARSTSGCGCGCKNVPSYVDVILPPSAVELPCGLGYSPAAAPLVATAYDCSDTCISCVPVTSPYTCTKLVTPLCPELRAYAKPIIL
ncbi:unnamed protein product [Diatraea saccharalis]|uniref:Uncharacterized protein n=1 Tax=Diatraea saccharalis TaxID=40085 RepID=A0A9N9RCY4_9NEOP|nr:unnamed protein product [Diatraea saccharalis]